MYGRPEAALRIENVVAGQQWAWMVSRRAAGRVTTSALGVKAVGSGGTVTSWCVACVRRPEMQQHELWTSPEEVVRHWVEISPRVYPTHRSWRPQGALDRQCMAGPSAGWRQGCCHWWTPFLASFMGGYRRGLMISRWGGGGDVIA